MSARSRSPLPRKTSRSWSRDSAGHNEEKFQAAKSLPRNHHYKSDGKQRPRPRKGFTPYQRRNSNNNNRSSRPQQRRQWTKEQVHNQALLRTFLSYQAPRFSQWFVMGRNRKAPLNANFFLAAELNEWQMDAKRNCLFLCEINPNGDVMEDTKLAIPWDQVEKQPISQVHATSDHDVVLQFLQQITGEGVEVKVLAGKFLYFNYNKQPTAQEVNYILSALNRQALRMWILQGPKHIHPILEQPGENVTLQLMSIPITTAAEPVAAAAAVVAEESEQ